MASIKNLVARDLLRGNLVVKNANVEERVRRLEESSAEYNTAAYALRVDAAVIGQQDKDHVYVGAGGIQIKSNTIVRGEWQSDGDIFIGSDISDPGKTYLSVFAVAQTYNGEAMEAGDMLIGDNSANKANILWDKSAGHMKFRGGTTVQSYLDTDGSIVAGIDSVTLDSNGITINAQSQTYLTGGKSIDFYSVTDDFDIAMITATRYNAGGDEYVTLQLQVADDLTHGVNYTGHTNPMLVLCWDQYGRSAGAVDIANAALIVGGPSFTDISPAVAGNVYAGNDLYAVNNIIISLGSAKIGNGAVIGSASANPGYGDLRVGGGIYVGTTGSDAATGNVQITNDFISNNGGIGLGNSGFSPGQAQIIWDCRIAGSGLRPWDGTYHQAYAYVPLQNYISVYEGASWGGSSSGTAITLPSSVPYYAKAVVIYTEMDCNVIGAYITWSPGNSGTGLHHLTIYTHKNSGAGRDGVNQGIVAINSSTPRRIYYSHNAQGGTITHWTRIVGYFI